MTRFSNRALLALVGAALLFSHPTHAQNGETVLQNGDFSAKTQGWILPAPTKAQTETVSVVGAPALAPPTALRLNITPVAGEKPWNVILRQTLGVGFKSGQKLRMSAWMRSPQNLKALAFVETGAPDYLKSLEKEVALSSDWRLYEFDGQAKKDANAGEVSLGFHLGYGVGTVELTGVTLSRDGETTTVGASATAPVSLLQNGDFSAPLEGSWNGAGTLPLAPQRVEGGGPNGKPFVRIPVASNLDSKSWDARFGAAKTVVPINAGDLIAVRFWARSPQNLRVAGVFQSSAAPFDKVISRPVTLSSDWKEYRLFGVAKSALEAGGSNFEFHLAYGTGTVEIAHVRVENFGAIPQAAVEAQVGPQSVDFWGGQVPNDAWKKAAFERIEKHRKADVKIRVVDKNGKPVRGAKVKLAQTRQKFRWGSAVVAGRLIDNSPDNLRYQSEVARLFNTVVFENDLKWDNRNPRKDEQALEALKWLRARNIQARGHTLVWGSRRNLPPEVAAVWDEPEKLREMVRGHVREQVARYKGQLYVWDAVNEAVTNTELWEKLGWDEFANVFKIAKEVDPGVRLAYNDYNISNENQNPLAHQAQRRRVAELVKMLQTKGAPLDIYGDQAHFGTPLTTPARMIEIWNEAAKLGLSIEITEFDAGISDDKMHGDYVRDALIAAFSVPQIESFVLWGFWEGSHWRAHEGGAMFRRDWSKRPAQNAFEQLVLREWKTNLTLLTDASGVVQTRGFLGDYRVQIGEGARQKLVPLKLDANGARLQIAF